MPAGIESALLLMALGVPITEEPTGLEVFGWHIVALRMPTCRPTLSIFTVHHYRRRRRAQTRSYEGPGWPERGKR